MQVVGLRYLKGAYAMKFRIKFSKEGHLKFIGHLDLLRLMQRCIKKAELPVAYSKGFNPHQLIYIALPLSLGATSEGEYMDIELTEDSLMTETEIKDKLNAVFPAGLKVEKVSRVKDKAKSGMAAVDGAEYKVFISKEKMPVYFNEKTEAFFEQKEIWIEKTGKKETKKINIKDKIYRYCVQEDKDFWIIHLLLAAGSKDNLKLETLIEALYQYIALDYNGYDIDIHRVDIYSEVDNQLIPLSNL